MRVFVRVSQPDKVGTREGGAERPALPWLRTSAAMLSTAGGTLRWAGSSPTSSESSASAGAVVSSTPSCASSTTSPGARPSSARRAASTR